MITLAKLKHDLDISKSLGDIIDVLKAAAIIQFQSLQAKEKPYSPFAGEAEASLRLLIPKEDYNPYFIDRKELPSAIVTITSDEGFLGELNSLLINTALEERKSPSDEIIVLGERGSNYMAESGLSYTSFPGIPDEIDYKYAGKIRDHLIKGYRGRFGRICVVYPRFHSLTYQKAEVFRALPYTDKGLSKRADPLFDEAYIEPSKRRVIEVLIDIWLAFKLFDIFWSSKQSEYAARIMHLEGSTVELKDLNHDLSLAYFRQVHALRDRSIREISASKVLLEKRHS